MKSILTLLSIGLGSSAIVAAQVEFDLNSLPSYGTGTNRSAFVVDWNNGESNEITGWRYNWNGTATMEDMMSDIAGSSGSNLFIRWDSDAGFGAFLFGLGKQNGASAFDVINAVNALGASVSSNFVNGVWDIDTGSGWEPPASFTGEAKNTGDFYAGGFGWTSYVAGSGPDFSTSISDARFTSPSDWTATSLGISDVELVDDGWYGLGNGRVPNTVPEPTVAPLLLAFVAGIVFLSRRRR